jgi:hypothetical protein
VTKLVSVSRKGQVLPGSCALAKVRYPTHSGGGGTPGCKKKANKGRVGVFGVLGRA